MKLERIILPFVAMLWFNAACGQLICQTGLAETTSIRQIKFSDFTFVRQNSAEIIPLQKGEYAGPDNHSYALMNVTYGDIAGDGIEQAVGRVDAIKILCNLATKKSARNRVRRVPLDLDDTICVRIDGGEDAARVRAIKRTGRVYDLRVCGDQGHRTILVQSCCYCGSG